MISTAAHFKHDIARQPVVPQAQASCWKLRWQYLEATAKGIGLGATAKYMQQTTSGAVGKGLNTTTKYLRVAPRSSAWAPRQDFVPKA